MTDELELFDRLVRHWHEGSEYTSQSMERKLEEGKVAQRIRRKLSIRPVGRPKSINERIFTVQRVIIYDYLDSLGESRKYIKQAVMAEMMGWPDSKAREFDRSYDPDATRWRGWLNWMLGRGWGGLSETRIQRAYARVLDKQNGDN